MNYQNGNLKVILDGMNRSNCILYYVYLLILIIFTSDICTYVFSISLILQGDGALFCGLHIDNGRIRGAMKKALREIIEKYSLNMRITPNQNLILCDIHHSWKKDIAATLAQAGFLVKFVIIFLQIIKTIALYIYIFVKGKFASQLGYYTQKCYPKVAKSFPLSLQFTNFILVSS